MSTVIAKRLTIDRSLYLILATTITAIIWDISFPAYFLQDIAFFPFESNLNKPSFNCFKLR